MDPDHLASRYQTRLRAHALAPVARSVRATIATSLLAAVSAIAQTPVAGYPVKPVRLIAPYPAGGSSDLIARIVAQKFADAYGQQFVVDNRAGAGGVVGSELAARATPDGYTLLLGNIAPLAISATLQKLGYDPLRDFAPISMLATGPTIVVVHPSVPARTMGEFIALAKSQPGKLNYGSGGNGTPAHLTTELLKQMARINLVHVPYKGTGQSVNDLIAGQIQLVFASTPVALPHMKTGRLRALAVSSAKRTPLAPDLPTVAESGVPGFEFDSWWSLLAPARTPAALIGMLNAETGRTLKLTDVKERFADLGVDPVYGSPAEYSAFLRREIDKFGGLIKSIGLKPE
jgi:tripartite-type tricarboxylate transporter receptor subunit TctC